MNFKQLQYFILVAECGGFSQASEAIHLAQSALSRHVRLLEESLGTRLFNRTGRGVVLTEQDEYLLSKTRAILDQIEHVENSLKSWYEYPVGHVRLGMTQTAMIYGAASLIREARERFPEISLALKDGLSSDLCKLVVDNHLDLALVFEVPNSDLLRTEKLRDEELCLVAAPGLELADTIPVARLAELNLVLPTEHRLMRLAVERSMTRAGVECRPGYTIDSVTATKTLVMHGDVVAVLPRRSVTQEVEAGRLICHRLEEPQISMPLVAIYRAKQQLGRAAQTTLLLMRELFST